MIVRQSLLDVEPIPRAVAIGSFDGVHRGHQTVIGSAVAAGAAGDLRSAVVTFHPHPLEVLRPELAPPELSSLARKAALVEELGPDELIVIRFDAAFSQISADDFADHVLRDALDARHVSVGENFRYGHGAHGTTETLTAEGARLGFGVEVVPLLRDGGDPVSSSRIRGLLADGDVEEAAALLGRPPWLEGAVVRGDGRGRDLGFPTANLSPLPKTPLPKTGHLRRERTPARIRPHRRDQHRIQPDVHRQPRCRPDRGLPPRFRPRHLRLADPAPAHPPPPGRAPLRQRGGPRGAAPPRRRAHARARGLNRPQSRGRQRIRPTADAHGRTEA